jgi:hypothetical protein
MWVRFFFKKNRYSLTRPKNQILGSFSPRKLQSWKKIKCPHTTFQEYETLFDDEGLSEGDYSGWSDEDTNL